MRLHTFIINLEKADARMQHMQSEMEKIHMPFTRVEAVYGPALPTPILGFNETRFNQLTGKVGNPREVGCYLSHMKAFDHFLATDAEYALILEDDVRIPENLPQLLEEACAHSKHWDILRLSSSREGAYLTISQLAENHKLCYNTKVLKNTGAYLISRYGAEQCRQQMLPMCLPYDVALDREWDFGLKAACIIPFPVKLEDFPTQIIHKAKRLRLYRATTFHLFHLLTRIQRKRYRTQCFKEVSSDSE